MVAIKDSDSNFKGLRDIIKNMDQTVIKTGFIEGEKGSKRQKGDVDNVALAAIHEFGTTKAGRRQNTRIPARPFMRPTFEKHKEDYENQIERGITVSLKNKDINPFKTMSEAVGIKMKSDIVKAIDSLPRDLAESTIKKKGSSKALVDTGQLRQAVNYFINKK